MASGGWEPAKDDPRGRLKAARKDPARRGEQVPSGRRSPVKKYLKGPGTPLFRVPVDVPMVLRNAPGLTEAPPGRKQRAQIAAPRSAMG